MTTTITGITTTTEDAAPTGAPFKISNKTGYTLCSIAFTPHTASEPIGCWMVVFNSASRISGRRLGNLGAVCGIHRCGEAGVMPLSATAGVQRTIAFQYANLPTSGDGAYPSLVTVRADTEGWA